MRLLRVVHPLPAPGPVNSYVVLGPDGAVLVDAGPPGEAAREAIGQALARLGAGWGDVRAVLLTHAHRDHAGQARGLERLGIPVYVHPAEEAVLRFDESAQAAELLAACGYGPEVRAAVARDMAWARSFEPPAGWRPLEAGMELDLAGLRWRVVHVPGHSPGHVLLAAEGGNWFGGDLLLPGIPPVPTIHTIAPTPDGGPVAQLRESLQRMRRLAPERLHPGHGDPIADTGPRLDEAVAHIDRRLRRVAGLAAEGRPAVADLVARLFPGAAGLGLLFALMDVLAYALCLEARGELELIRDVPLQLRAG